MLQVQDVDLFYGASQALRSVSLGARPGRVTAVMGRNGVGKTSLMRALTGRQPIGGGRILWEGKDISRMPPAARARRFRLCPAGARDFSAFDRGREPENRFCLP